MCIRVKMFSLFSLEQFNHNGSTFCDSNTFASNRRKIKKKLASILKIAFLIMLNFIFILGK